MQTSALQSSHRGREASRGGFFDSVDRRFRALARSNPHALIALAAGMGFVLGSRQRSRLLGLAVALATRLVAEELLRAAPVDHGAKRPACGGQATIDEMDSA